MKIPIDKITPSSMARTTDNGLYEAIKRDGLQKPIRVRRVRGGRYELLDGLRRIVACKELGMTEIEAMVTND